MTDNTRESLSALIDGEASEIEIHKLLRQFKTTESDTTGSDTEAAISVPEDLHSSWARYQEIRSVINASGNSNSSSGKSLRMTASQHLELRISISSAIEAEETYQLKGLSSLAGSSSIEAENKRKSVLTRYRAPAAGLAIAASLIVAIFVGLSPAGESTQNAGQGTLASSEISTVSNSPIAAQTVSTQSVATASIGRGANVTSAEFNSLEQQLLSSGEDGMLVDKSELKELNEEQKQQMRAYLQLHDRMARSNPNRRTVNFNATNK